MNPALWVSQSGLDAQQMRLSVIANNLANVSTTGYKEGRPIFEDLMYQNLRQAGGQTSQDTRLPTGLYLGTGVRVVGTEKMFTQGTVQQTGGTFDIAIEGRGFYQILMPDGTLAYTRDGAFNLNDQGQMVTASGYILQPGINIPVDAQNVSIGTDGTVAVQLPGATSPTQVGSIQTVDFINPGGLQPMGQNLFVETASSGSPQQGTPGLNGLGRVIQGALEGSNVNVVEEMVNMIEAQRAYEINSKSIQTADDMLRYMTNNL